MVESFLSRHGTPTNDRNESNPPRTRDQTYGTRGREQDIGVSLVADILVSRKLLDAVLGVYGDVGDACGGRLDHDVEDLVGTEL